MSSAFLLLFYLPYRKLFLTPFTYTDKEGDKYYFAPSWGDIRKSPIIDMNFFLRIFAKQNKERLLMEERNKQNKE